MIQDLFILGATGNVGSTLVKQIINDGDTDPVHNNPTRIVGLASSNSFLYEPGGIRDQDSLEFISRDSSRASHYSGLKHLLDLTFTSDSLVFVDTTAADGQKIIKFHLDVAKSQYGMVTANKNPLAFSNYKIFQHLISNPKIYGYRCSVMAGSDAVPFLRDSRDLNDKVQEIEGCLSGTNMYVASGCETRRISEVVIDAFEKGYTEPDPRDDLVGLDVARKLVVLARTAGFNVGIDGVAIRPFIPVKYLQDESLKMFFERLKRYDDEFADLVASSKERGYVLRYVATMTMEGSHPGLEVSLKEVPIDSQLGRLEGRTNKLLITTNYYPRESPYIIEGPGAGLDITARNIRRDLLDLLPERLLLDRVIKTRRMI